MRRVSFTLLSIMLVCGVAGTAMAQGRGFRGERGGHGGPGRGGHGPDANFVADRDDFHFLLEHHDEILREVKELKNGVETVTESENKEVTARIQKHVAAMYQRVEHKRPIRTRDPLFAEIFKHADKIKMGSEKTEKGVRVRHPLAVSCDDGSDREASDETGHCDDRPIADNTVRGARQTG